MRELYANRLQIKKEVEWRYAWCVMRDCDIAYVVVLCYTCK